MSTTARKMIVTSKPSRSVIVPRITVKRILLLIVSCLFVIFVAIILMNLQTPKSMSSIAKIKAASKGEAPVETAQEKTTIKPDVPVTETPPEAPKAETPKVETPTAEPPKPDMPKSNDTAVAPGDNTATAVSGTVSEADIDYLKTKKLLIPVVGVTEKQLRDSFYDGRSEGRIHQALDIMAAQGTPVVASADGKVKLHTSARGGIMIYVTDLSQPYAYYYGHLQRYADGIYDGQTVRRGQIIAYVGDTGNAGAGNFHLHFGIAKVSALGKWTGGEPINPYPLLANK